MVAFLGVRGVMSSVWERGLRIATSSEGIMRLMLRVYLS